MSVPLLGLTVAAGTASAIVATSPTVVNEQSLGTHWFTDNRAGGDDHVTAGTGTK